MSPKHMLVVVWSCNQAVVRGEIIIIKFEGQSNPHSYQSYKKSLYSATSIIRTPLSTGRSLPFRISEMSG